MAYIRHRLTEYDSLLDEGYDPESARFFVLDEMNGVLGGVGLAAARLWLRTRSRISSTACTGRNSPQGRP